MTDWPDALMAHSLRGGNVLRAGPMPVHISPDEAEDWIETETYVPLSKVREQLESLAEEFARYADGAEQQQIGASTPSEGHVMMGKALAWSAAYSELNRLAASFPEEDQGKDRA